MKESVPRKVNNSICITGTSKGIGRGLALFYLNKGKIVFGCSRSKSTIIDNANYFHFEADISDENDVKNFTRYIRESGGVDVLINNAGVASMNHIMLTPKSSLTKVISANFIGTFLMIREISKIMIKKKYGRIINFSTIAVPLNLAGEAIYASSKAAIEQLTKNAAKELGEYGITVNCIGPTPIPTDMIAVVPKNKINDIINHQIVKRIGHLDDVTNVLDFMISEKSNFITSQIIYLGGITK